MNIDDIYQSKYLKASDLPDDGSPTIFTIAAVRVEEIGKEKQEKPVIYFKEVEKGFVCNVTNKNTIKKVLGTAETNEWKGKTINLYSTEVEFGGEMVESIRVKLKAEKPNGARTDAIVDQDGDPIPFD